MAFTQTVRGFLKNSYMLIDPANPTQPLVGNTQILGLQFLNELISSYSGTGLMLTVAKQVDFTMSIGQQYVTFADANYLPAADVQQGRLANLQNAWLTLDGVTYPLIDESRNVFYDSYKYDPQQGLPRFVIIQNQTNVTSMRVYPSPSQVYTLSVYGKFELPSLLINDNMAEFPRYFIRYLRLAVAKDFAFYLGRTEAWTEKLEDALVKAELDMQATSSVNLTITAEHDSYLNGSWRVKAGI